LAGGFEPVAKPAFEDGRIPGKNSFANYYNNLGKI
jgi:hypothetical protein